MVFNHIISQEDHNAYKGYLVLPPAGTSRPRSFFCIKVYGVNEILKATADRYAQMGFVVLCPNVY